MDDVRRRVIVSGRVQGVFFRDACRSTARELGVRGSVTNLPDGTVEVIAQGRRRAVERLVEWCRTGPPRAEVTGIDVTDETATDDSLPAVDDFRIEH